MLDQMLDQTHTQIYLVKNGWMEIHTRRNSLSVLKRNKQDVRESCIRTSYLRRESSR